MMSLTCSLPDAVPARPRLRRLADDAGMTVVVCAWAAVVITLVNGAPQDLYPQMVFAICIGMVALAVIDGARLLVWTTPHWSRGRVLAFLALVLVTAPMAHYAGCVLGALILGHGWPDMRGYPGGRGQLNMILFTLLGICAMALLVLNRERVERIKVERREARTRADAIERHALQVQLRMLQAQIEPHMLFNTLANLQGLIAIDPQRAGAMLDHLIQYLRATLGATRAETVTLAQEFEAIDAYLGLMAVRMGPRLTYRCTLPEALRTARVPALLLQPLVENAIIHGLEPKMDGGTVTVQARMHDGLLEISVSDNGLGLGAQQPDAGGTAAQDDGAGHGVGASTTRARLHAIYGERAALVLAPRAPHGALARLTLPLEAP
jgi:signal transduction histidine kinase